MSQPVSLQVILGAGPTQVSSQAIFCQNLVFQNNAANAVRYGDSSVSATKGIQLSPGNPGGAGTQSTPIRNTLLNLWYLFGTQGQAIDVLYEN